MITGVSRWTEIDVGLHSNAIDTSRGSVNPLECKGNYSATSNNMKLVTWYTGRWWGVLHLVQRWQDWAGPQPSHEPLLVVPNVTVHPSTASAAITVLLYNGPLLYGFNVPIKGFRYFVIQTVVLNMLYSIVCKLIHRYFEANDWRNVSRNVHRFYDADSFKSVIGYYIPNPLKQ